ncbi:MAG: hypothetical protein JZU60_01995 [Ilumatobacteraceae bacterium]|jgi:hypothetical protein|nr:hypothetical protein [Ilumatobacteraceae bacterium]
MEDNSSPLKILETSYLHKREAGYVIPLLQSATTGAIIAALVLVLMAMSHAELLSMFYWTLVTFLVVMLIMWIVLLYSWFVLSIERVTGRDLNGDGVIGPKIGDEVIHPVRVDVTNGNVTARASFENGRKLADVADAILLGVPFSQRELSDILSRSEFERMRDEMLARELLVMRNADNPQQGYVLTPEGMAMMTDITSRPEGFY